MNRQISDLYPYLPLLEACPNLNYLSLKGNRLKSLPINLSKLMKLSTIDLRNNPLDVRLQISFFDREQIFIEFNHSWIER